MKAGLRALLLIASILALGVASGGRQPSPSRNGPAHTAQPRRQTRASNEAGRRGLSISGKLLIDGQPLAGVTIVISGAGSAATLMETMMGKLNVEETEVDGRFRFDGLRSAAYTLRPMLTGYVVQSGVVDSAGQQIYYRPGDFASIRMVKGGVITGRVLGESGSPMVGISVRAFRIKDLEGRRSREVTAQNLDALQPSTTDDRGVYRIYGLEPGVYVVCAGGTLGPEAQGPFDNDSAVYHPGGAVSDASEVAVRAGQESIGIDISYRELPGHTVSGTLGGRVPGGALFSGAAIMLNDTVTGALLGMRVGLGLNDAGNRVFAFSGIPDGTYELTAIGGLMGDETTAVPPRKVVVRGSDVTGVELVLAPLAEISGRLVLDTTPAAGSVAECTARPRAAIDQAVIAVRAGVAVGHGTLGPLFYSPEGALPDDKGEFKAKLLSGGLYYIQMKLPGDDLYVRSMTLPAVAEGRPGRNPAEGLDLKPGEKLAGVTITMARGAASLKGRLTAVSSEPKTSGDAERVRRDKSSEAAQGPEAMAPNRKFEEKPPTPAVTRLPDRLQVLAVPAEPEAAMDLLRYYQSAVEVDGGFAFSNMAPGQYYLLARVTPDEQWNDPAALPDWYKPEQRKKAYRAAKRANVSVELKPCAAVKDYSMPFLE